MRIVDHSIFGTVMTNLQSTLRRGGASASSEAAHLMASTYVAARLVLRRVLVVSRLSMIVAETLG